MIQYPISVFSPTHFLFLLTACTAAGICAYFLAKKYSFNKKVIWVCAIIGLACEAERLLFFVKELPGGGYRLPANLIPLNTCPFMLVLIFILALSEFPQKRRKLLSFMYPMMVAGAFMGMLLAGEALSSHGLLELATYRYFFYHGMVICLGLYLYLSKPFQYNIKDYGMALFLSFSYLIAGIWVNGFFGWDPEVNHMFVVRPPVEGLPILNFNYGWTGYILAIMTLGMFLVTVCYLPVIINAVKRKAQKEK